MTLTAPYSGTLLRIDAGKGSVVKRNETVAVIYSQQVESSYGIAKADFEQAQDAMDRIQKVYASGGVTEVQMKDVLTKLEKAEAALEGAKKAVADCSVKSPFAGVVSEVYPSGGEELTMGAGILKITDISDLKINITIYENEIGAVKAGMAAVVDIPALGIKDAAARVIEKGVLSSRLTHSYVCAVKLGKNLRGLMPGMAAKVRFESVDEEERIVIPAAAVQLDSDGKYVWISDSCTVKKRRIATDGYSGKGVIVSEGLSNGDKVITEGYQKVSTGMKIEEVE